MTANITLCVMFLVTGFFFNAVFFQVCANILLSYGSCRGAMCQQAAVCLPCACRVVISLQVQSWAGEVMHLGAVFLTPLDSPEKKTPNF